LNPFVPHHLIITYVSLSSTFVFLLSLSFGSHQCHHHASPPKFLITLTYIEIPSSTIIMSDDEDNYMTWETLEQGVVTQADCLGPEPWYMPVPWDSGFNE